MRPIFVVGPPCAGARLVADALATAPGCWVPGALLAPLPSLDPPDGSRNGRLEAADCTPHLRQTLRAHLQVQLARNARTASTSGIDQESPAPRLVHGSPRNSLLVPFLDAAFPDATFVYVHRRPADALAESLLLWRAGTAITYPDLPGWTSQPWSFLLVPGWQELIGRPLAEVVTEQWLRTMHLLTEDLERLAPERWCVTGRDALRRDPLAETTRLARYLGLGPVARPSDPPPTIRSSSAGSSAARTELEPYLDRTQLLTRRAADWLAGP